MNTPCPTQTLQYLLTHCSRLEFFSRSGERSLMQWNHHGQGRVTRTVHVTAPEKVPHDRHGAACAGDITTIVFDEWIQLAHAGVAKDQKRWTLQGDHLRLERLRAGVFEKIFEFECQGNAWKQKEDHFCAPDTYSALLILSPKPETPSLSLSITVHGPRKEEFLQTVYYV